MVAQKSSDGTLCVSNRPHQVNLFAVVDRRLRRSQQVLVEMLSQLVVLTFSPLQRVGGVKVGRGKNRAKIQPIRFPVMNRTVHVQQTRLPDRFFQRAETKLSEVFPHLFGKELEEGLNEFGGAAEAFAQLRILRCHTHRTRVEVTHAHEDATAHDHRCCREAIFLCTQ